MKLTKRERTALEVLFERFDRDNITYVVSRRYDDLPEAVMGSDIDLYFRAEEFDSGVETCRRVGFEHRSPSNISNTLDLAERAIRNPLRSVGELLRSPSGVLRLVRGSVEHKQDYRNYRLRYGTLKLDLQNHLAYVSPYYELKHGDDDVASRARIRVDPAVERRLYERRRPYNGFYVPSPADELAHVVAHCVFDKRGTFSSYYTARCNSLFDDVSSEERSDEQFVELLTMIFYKAADLVYDLVERGEYNAIRSELLRFDDY